MKIIMKIIIISVTYRPTTLKFLNYIRRQKPEAVAKTRIQMDADYFKHVFSKFVYHKISENFELVPGRTSAFSIACLTEK